MLLKPGLSLAIALILFSCGNPLPSFDHVDMSGWKDDKNACLGNRKIALEPFAAQKEKLKALSEMDIVKTLGKPDRNELYKRNQKFYYYLLEPGIDCGVDNPSPKKLVIRFNAMGLAKEVTIE